MSRHESPVDSTSTTPPLDELLLDVIPLLELLDVIPLLELLDVIPLLELVDIIPLLELLEPSPPAPPTDPGSRSSMSKIDAQLAAASAKDKLVTMNGRGFLEVRSMSRTP